MKDASDPAESADRDKPLSEEAQTAKAIEEVFAPFEGSVTEKRMILWLRKLGVNAKDEVLQFRVLQRCCRENEKLKDAFEAAGYGDLTKLETIRVTPETAKLIQGFNRLIESKWRIEQF